MARAVQLVGLNAFFLAYRFLTTDAAQHAEGTAAHTVLDVEADPCFPIQVAENTRFYYFDCCRHTVIRASTEFSGACFNEQFTVERCCAFPFGPTVRGFPWSGDRVQELDAGRAGRLQIALSLPGDESHGQMWYTGWFYSQVLSEVSRLAASSAQTWPEAAPVLRELAAAPRLRILETGSGTGFSAVAGARLGHSVMATDFLPSLLALQEHNAEQNGVSISTALWDMQQRAPEALVRGGPYDLAFPEMEGAIIGLVHRQVATDVFGNMTYDGAIAGQPMRSTTRRIIRNVMELLTRTSVGRFLLVGHYKRESRELVPVTREVVRVLRIAGQTHRRPCAEDPVRGCPRKPIVGPFGWLSDEGLAPKSFHTIILW